MFDRLNDRRYNATVGHREFAGVRTSKTQSNGELAGGSMRQLIPGRETGSPVFESLEPRLLLDTSHLGSFGPDSHSDLTASLLQIDGENPVLCVELLPGPDLVVSGATAPADLIMSQPFQVSWTVENQGTAPADGWWSDSVYYSSDAALSSEDLQLGSVYQFGPSVPVGETYSTDLTVYLPGGLPLGTGYLLVETDGSETVAEDNESNNVFGLLVTVSAPDVDLVITDTDAPAGALYGETIVLTWTVENRGGEAADAPGWFDSCYISTDSNLDDSDLFLGTYDAGDHVPLAAGNSYTGTLSVTIPSDAPDGEVYLLFVTDHAPPWGGGELPGARFVNMQGETDETNNIVARAVTIRLPQVDLTVTQATAPDSAPPSAYINVSWSVTNQGAEATSVPYWYDGVYLSDDALFGDDMWLTSYEASVPVAAGAGYDVTDLSVRIPSYAKPGAKYLLIVADAYNDQPEVNEDNNVYVLPITVEGPDLELTTATAPAAANLGQQISIGWTVTNIGQAGVTTYWRDRVYLSEDPEYDVDDVRLREITRPTSLTPGASYEVSYNVTLPRSTVRAGTFYLLFITDDDGAVGEMDETNNLVAAPLELGGPDLAVTDGSVDPVSGAVGNSFHVSMTVQNVGSMAALGSTSYQGNGWYDALYLSPDTVPDGTDTKLFEQWAIGQAPLGAGASYVIERDVTVPKTAPGGAFYLLFVTDSNADKQGETGEANNILAVPISLAAPDLVFVSADAPTSAVVGEAVPVSWTVANQGSAEADAYWWDYVFVSTDTVFDAQDVQAAYVSSSDLTPVAVDDGYTRSRDVTIPKVTAGDYYLLFYIDRNNAQGELSEQNNVGAVPISIYTPDLALTDAVAPDTGVANASLEIGWTVTNVGAVAAPADWYDSVYLSADEVVDSADRQLVRVSEASRSPLGPGDGYTETRTVTIPGAAGTGAFYLIFCTDRYDYYGPSSTYNNLQGETDEGNNALALPITLTAPDLELTSATAPSWAVVNDVIEVTYIVTNVGVPPAEANWYDRVLLSDDEAVSTGDRTLATQWVDDQTPLVPGAAYQMTLQVTIPDVPTGTKYLLFVTDTYSYQGETDESNNLLALPIELVAPDLVVSSASVSTDVVSGGQAVEVSWTVRNQGDSAAPADWWDRVYLSKDATWDNLDTYVFGMNMAALTPLGAGQSYSVQQTVTIPEFAPGAAYLLVYADANLRQGETNENNNVLAVPVTVMAIDLQVTGLTVEPTALQSGQQVAVRWNVLNAGNGSVEELFYDRLVVHNQTTDQEVLTRTFAHDPSQVGPLGPGQVRPMEHTFSLPDGNIAAGQLAFTMTTDSADQIYEHSSDGTAEANNMASVTVTSVLAPYPDLEVTGLGVTAASLMQSGAQVTVTWTLTNTGNRATSGSWSDLLLVRNLTLDQNASVQYAYYDQEAPGNGGIGPGESRVRHYTFRLPDGPIGAGELEFSVTANHQFQVFEANEAGTGRSNNTTSVVVTSVLAPYPDLVITEIVVPAEAYSGQAIPISWTIRNQGDAPASGPWTDQVYLSTDPAAGGDELFGSFSFNGTLAVGASMTRIQAVSLPLDYSGDRFVVVHVNSTEEVYELVRENNILVADRVLPIQLSPYPNLVVSVVIPPTEPLSGQETTVQWTVTNMGTGSTNAAAWYDGVWMSQDTQLDRPRDVFLGEELNASYLGVGESYVNTLTARLPQDAEGQYYFIVYTDYKGKDRTAVYEYVYEDDNVTVSVPVIVQVSPSADLQVTVVNAPETGFSSLPITVSWRVTNEGDAPTVGDKWLDQLYLSEDEILDPTDTWVGGSFHRGALDAGQYYDVAATVPLPTGMSGPHYVFVVTDTARSIYEHAAETNNDNHDPSATNIYLIGPDLEVTAVEAPETALASHAFSFTYQTSNLGTARTDKPSWLDGFYLSEDDQWQPSDLFLGERQSGGFLDLSGSRTSGVTFTLPDGLDGLYYVFAFADYDNGLFELNNENNVGSDPQPVRIFSRPADLTVPEFSAPTTAVVGEAIRVKWTVANEGTGDTAVLGWQDRIVLSEDAQVGPDDHLLGIYPHKGLLDAGVSYDHDVLIQVPWMVDFEWLEPGDYYLLAVTDSQDDVYEGAREDNNFAALPVTVVRRTADLAVTQITADATAWSGRELTVNWRVENAGTGKPNSDGWYDGVYLSSTSDVGFDVFLGFVPNPRGLLPGTYYDRQWSFTLPIDLEGTFHVTVYADVPLPPDFKDAVLERPSETNNAAVASDPTVVYLSPVPDLVVQSVDAPPEAVSGQSFELSWTVRNQGGAQAEGNWIDAVFLSPDQIYDPGIDLYLGYAAIENPLAQDQTYTRVLSLDIPAGMSGPYYVFVATDYHGLLRPNKVYERDHEDNNISYDPEAMLVRLAPPSELVIGEMTIPVNATPGQEISITYTVRNLGPNAAIGHWYDALYASVDKVWDIRDLLIGYFDHRGDVAPLAAYTETFEAPLPGLLPGNYHVIIRTDIRNHVPESDETNNFAASLDRVAMDFEELLLGMPAAGTLGQGQSVYYRVDVPARATLRIDFDSDATEAGNELYVRYGMMPTRGDYDFIYDEPYYPDQTVVVPMTRMGTYFVLAYGQYVPASDPAGYAITASLLEFGLESVTPSRAGNVGNVTFELTGALLASDMTYELVAPDGETISPMSVYFQDAAHLYVTYSLLGLPTGLYDVRVVDGEGTESRLPGSVQVVPGVGPKLVAGLDVPEVIAPRPFEIAVEYENAGDVDMIAPMLHVVGPAQVQYGLIYGTDDGRGEIRFLGYSPTGPAGILRPGQREHVKLFCRPLPTGVYWFTLTSLSVDPANPTPQLVNWSTLGESYQPPFADTEAWLALWTIFTAQAGSSWQEVIARMAERLTAEPYVDGKPNILVQDLLQQGLADSMSSGGGLTDQTPPWVLTGAAIEQPVGVSAVDLIFSESIDPASFSVDDLTLVGPGGQTIAPLDLSETIDRLYRVSFPTQYTPGAYYLTVGCQISDTVGYYLDQDRDGAGGEPGDDVFVTSFRISPEGRLAGQLYVASHEPAGLRDQREGVDHVILEFSQPLYSQTFTVEDVRVEGPGGAVRATGVAQLSQKTYRVTFVRQTELGIYTVTVGPDVLGLTGSPMDQDADGVAGEPGADCYVATFTVGDIHGPRVVSYSPAGWMDVPVESIEVTFSEPIDAGTFTLADVSVTGPGGPVTPTGLAPLGATTFRVELPKQKLGTDYVFTIGPDVADEHGNLMDQDWDNVNGGPNDVFVGTFHIDPGVRLLPDLTGLQALNLMDGGGIMDEVTVSGRVVYDGLLPSDFPWTALVTVQLWEQDGDRDPLPGAPSSSDSADDLISVTNAITGTGLTDIWGGFRFIQDLSGQPIYSLDVDEVIVNPLNPAETINDLARFYVVVYARNPYGFVVDDGTVQSTDPNPDGSSPWFTAMHPDINGAESPPTGVTSQWARLHNAPVDGSQTVIPMEAGPQPGFQHLTMADVRVSDPAFGLSEWIAYAATLLSVTAGVPPRKAVAVRYPSPNADDAYWSSADWIAIGSDMVRFPAIVAHEYGHALEFAANNYVDPPYGGGTYGVIQEGTSYTTTYSEGWASFVGAKVVERWPVGTPGGLPGHIVDYNRSGQFMETNNFWMGFDGYRYPDNNSAHDMFINTAFLQWLFDGVNDNANTGDLVLGAVTSIFWDFADGFDDDGVSDPAGLWNAFRTAAGDARLESFYMSYLAANPGSKRAMDAIFIDHGVSGETGFAGMAKIDDSYTRGNNAYDFGVLKSPSSLDGLVMSESAPGGQDTFRFSLPATSSSDKDVEYSLTVVVEFAARYGDLDVLVESIDWGTGNLIHEQDLHRGGGAASVTVSDLHSSRQYDFFVYVFGHGAVDSSGATRGGDFHPNYKLTINVKVPEPAKDKNDDDDDDDDEKDHDSKRMRVVSPGDPNDILGPEGFGPSHWVAAAQNLDYTIRFENRPDATAPARRVEIVSQLDEDLDWRTFRVGDFGWGDIYVDVPDNRPFYSERLDLTDSLGLYMDVTAGLDITTGKAFWTFTAIDPATGEMPVHALTGFLPPNDADGSGQGFACFTVRAKRDAVTGTVIDAQATIVFDTEAPMDTPAIFNTLDADLPASGMDALPSMTSGLTFDVSWSGADVDGGSALADYTVFVSESDGPFMPWLSDTTLTSAPFVGKAGHTYAFYSVTRDNAGNVEPAPAVPDAFTVTPDLVAPTVLSVECNGGQAQRDTIASIAFTFSEVVSVADGSGFGLVNDTTGQGVDLAAAVTGNGTDTILCDLSQVSLDEGRYTLTLVAAHVTDGAGNPLDANGDGTGGDDYVWTFFRLTCDANGDGKVDGAELAVWQANYDPLGRNQNTPATGDWDHDGDVDSADLALWQRRYNPLGVFQSQTQQSSPEVAPNESLPTSLSQPIASAPDNAAVPSSEPPMRERVLTTAPSATSVSAPVSAAPSDPAPLPTPITINPPQRRVARPDSSVMPVVPRVLDAAPGRRSPEAGRAVSLSHQPRVHARTARARRPAADDVVDVLAAAELAAPLEV